MRKKSAVILGSVLLAFSSIALSAGEATSFIYPVGNQNIAPTEQPGNANGFQISQNFNTGSDYVSTGSPNGGWCSDSSFAPVNTYISSTTCESKGYKWRYGHTGIDLRNGATGARVSAIANGIVYRVLNSDLSYGNVAILQHTLPNGKKVYSLYGHMRDPSSLIQGAVVTKGDLVGYVGKTIGTAATLPAHLHFAVFDEAILSKLGGLGLNQVFGYLSGDNGISSSSGNTTMPSNIFRYMYDPLLFINDRNNDRAVFFSTAGYWGVNVSNTQSVTTRTAYVVNSSGVAKSLQSAVNAGWLGSTIYWVTGSNWSYYPTQPIESQTLLPNLMYVFQARVPGLTLHYFLPGNNYLDARWRQDAAEFTTVNASLGFGRALRYTYNGNINPNWDANYYLSGSFCEQTVSGTLRYATVWVAYSKTDPLVRLVSYYNPFTGAYSNWVRVY